MKFSSSIRLGAVFTVIAHLAGCAAEPVPVGVKFLGQVAYVDVAANAAKLDGPWTPQPDDALDGQVPTIVFSATTRELVTSCGLGADATSRLALVRIFYDATGANWSGDHLHSEWTLVDIAAPVEKGNVVEVEMRQGSSESSRCVAVSTVRAKTMDAGGCIYARVEKRADGVFFYRSLYCSGLAQEGWKELTDPFAWDGLNGRWWTSHGNGIGWFKPPPDQTQ